MKHIHLLAAIACLVPALTANAQTPQQSKGLRQFSYQVRDAAADAYAQRQMYQTTFQGQVNRGPQGAGQYGATQYGAGQSCPANYYSGGSWPANYYGGGYCQDYGSDLSCYPRHNYTYGYQRPRSLVYPQQNSTGGAVVYPYYTHKGPSDFFQK